MIKIGKISIWKKGTNRMTSLPDFTVEIEIEENKAELIYRIVSAVERIAEKRKRGKEEGE